MREFDPIVETLEEIVVPVTIDGVAYTLHEATGEAACQYRNAAIACSRFGDKGKLAGIQGIGDLEPLLVSLCLRDAASKPVPQKVIRAWPARVQKRLYDTAKKISQLDETDDLETLKKQRDELDERIKEMDEGNYPNSPSATTDGSV